MPKLSTLRRIIIYRSNGMLCLWVVMCMCCSHAEAQTADTFNVYFPFNHYKIEAQAEAKIDSMIFKDVLIHGQKLIILGYADVVGGKQHNDSLSLLRAKSVADYLAGSGFDRRDITLCAGRGQILRANVKKEGYAEDRKVQIVIDQSKRTAASTVVKTTNKDTIVAKPNVTGDLKTMNVNQVVTLNNLLFVPGSSTLEAISYPALENLYCFLDENKTVAIKIEGNVCCITGNLKIDNFMREDGKTLSIERAKMVYDYLVSKGIYKGRLVYVGLGTDNPKILNPKTQLEAELNRRVDIRILSK